MKIRELIDNLNQFPDDLEVIIEARVQGGYYSPVGSIEKCIYLPDWEFSGEIRKCNEPRGQKKTSNKIDVDAILLKRV